MGLFWKSKYELKQEEERERWLEEEKRKQAEAPGQAKACEEELRTVLTKINNMRPTWTVYLIGDYEAKCTTKEGVYVNIRAISIPSTFPNRPTRYCASISVRQEIPGQQSVDIFHKEYCTDSLVTKQSYHILYNYLEQLVKPAREAEANKRKQQEEEVRDRFWNS